VFADTVFMFAPERAVSGWPVIHPLSPHVTGLSSRVCLERLQKTLCGF
jgi:hypothetical protein